MHGLRRSGPGICAQATGKARIQGLGRAIGATVSAPSSLSFPRIRAGGLWRRMRYAGVYRLQTWKRG